MTVTDERIRTQVRELYAGGLSKRGIADTVKIGRQTVYRLVADLPPPPDPPRERAGHALSTPTPSPLVHWRDLVYVPSLHRLWWPDLSDRCPSCNGRLYATPPDPKIGAVSCGDCAREIREVRP